MGKFKYIIVLTLKKDVPHATRNYHYWKDRLNKRNFIAFDDTEEEYYSIKELTKNQKINYRSRLLAEFSNRVGFFQGISWHIQFSKWDKADKELLVKISINRLTGGTK